MEKLIKKIKLIPKSYFSFADIRKISWLNNNSLKQALSRLVKNGEIFRLIKGVYANDLAKVDWEKLAEEIYAPSYLSLELILGQNGILSQKPLHLTLVTTKRSRKIEIAQNIIFYQHLQPKMFWGYSNENGIWAAAPEKAFLDLAYLSLNGYAKFDPEEMNLELLDKKIIQNYLNRIGNPKLTKLVNSLLRKITSA